MRNGIEQRPGVVGLRTGEQFVHRRLLDHLARAHHHHPIGEVGHHAHVVGDQHDRTAESIAQIAQQFQDLGLHGDIERGGRLVGDDHLRLARDGDRDHHALLLPAGELMRVVVDPMLGIGQPDHAQQLDRLGLGGFSAHATVRAQRLADLEPDGEQWVERTRRFLEHHRHLATAQRGELTLGHRGHRPIADGHQPAHRGRMRQQPDRGTRTHRLARPGLADDREYLTGEHLVGNIAHRVHGSAVGREGDRQSRNSQCGGLFTHRLFPCLPR